MHYSPVTAIANMLKNHKSMIHWILSDMFLSQYYFRRFFFVPKDLLLVFFCSVIFFDQLVPHNNPQILGSLKIFLKFSAPEIFAPKLMFRKLKNLVSCTILYSLISLLPFLGQARFHQAELKSPYSLVIFTFTWYGTSFTPPSPP